MVASEQLSMMYLQSVSYWPSYSKRWLTKEKAWKLGKGLKKGAMFFLPFSSFVGLGFPSPTKKDENMFLCAVTMLLNSRGRKGFNFGLEGEKLKSNVGIRRKARKHWQHRCFKYKKRTAHDSKQTIKLTQSTKDGGKFRFSFLTCSQNRCWARRQNARSFVRATDRFMGLSSLSRR